MAEEAAPTPDPSALASQKRFARTSSLRSEPAPAAGRCDAASVGLMKNRQKGGRGAEAYTGGNSKKGGASEGPESESNLDRL